MTDIRVPDPVLYRCFPAGNGTDYPPPAPARAPPIGQADPINSVAFSLDGKTLATGSYDLTVRLWNVATPSHARFDQALAAVLADETGAPPDAVEPFIAAAGLVSVFRVNLEGRDSDAEPSGQRVERALDLLEHGLREYAVSPSPPPAPQSTHATSARLTAAP